MQEPRRPEVVLVRTSAPVAVEPERSPRPPRHAWWMLSLTAFGLLLAGTSTGAEVPAPPEPLQVGLVVVDDAMSVSQGGVLVVPLQLRNSGPAVVVEAAQIYAEPVRQDARVPAPRGVAASSTQRFVALVAPDCRLVRPGGIAFRATVWLQVTAEGAAEDLVVDLDTNPAVRRAVARLCG